MVYMGSKRQYVKYLCPIIHENDVEVFIDAFTGVQICQTKSIMKE